MVTQLAPTLICARTAASCGRSGQTLTAQEGAATPGRRGGRRRRREAPAETAGEEADTTTPAVTREGEPGGTYTVQAGDTLSLIARDIYGSVGVWEALCSFNNLADCNSIEVGDVLQLPTEAQISSGASAPAAAATPAPAATTAPAATSEAEEEAEPSATTPVTTTTGITATETMTETEEAATDEEEEQAAEPAVDLITVLEAQGSFTNLVDALTAAGLADALKGPGPFTIFAPTDAAFAALPAGALDQLMSNPTHSLRRSCSSMCCRALALGGRDRRHAGDDQQGKRLASRLPPMRSRLWRQRRRA